MICQIQRNKVRQKSWIESVDWTKIDNVIAKEVGLTRERVRQVRKSLGLPSSRTLDRPRKYTFDTSGVNWSLNNRQIAKLYGMHETTVGEYRRQLDPHTRKPSPSKVLSDVDWRLSFEEIKRKYNLNLANSVLSYYKKKFAPELVERRSKS